MPPRTRWRIIHVGFFRSSGIVHPFRRGAEHHPQLFNLLIFNDFSVNPTDGHQGPDASTVIGQPISAGEESGRGPSAGGRRGPSGRLEAADPHVGVTR